jgi:hypothetical protein
MSETQTQTTRTLRQGDKIRLRNGRSALIANVHSTHITAVIDDEVWSIYPKDIKTIFSPARVTFNALNQEGVKIDSVSMTQDMFKKDFVLGQAIAKLYELVQGTSTNIHVTVTREDAGWIAYEPEN